MDLAKDVYLCRYVSSELATDVIIIVGGVKFYLHKVKSFVNSFIKLNEVVCL